jgi:hypothetical protein
VWVTLIVVMVIVVAAILFSQWLAGRRNDAFVAPPSHEAPTQLHRGDFDGSDREWLVAVFSSATCNTCAETIARASVLGSDAVAVSDVEVSQYPELHKRYNIDAVPITVIADSDGVVHRSFIGPVSSTHLWGALAELREPGSVPRSCSDVQLAVDPGEGTEPET